MLLLNRPYSINAQQQITSIDDNESEEYENEYENDNDFDNDRHPLLQAAWAGDYELVKKLVAEGADINLLQEGEGTPLVLAIRQERPRSAVSPPRSQGNPYGMEYAPCAKKDGW